MWSGYETHVCLSWSWVCQHNWAPSFQTQRPCFLLLSHLSDGCSALATPVTEEQALPFNFIHLQPTNQNQEGIKTQSFPLKISCTINQSVWTAFLASRINIGKIFLENTLGDMLEDYSQWRMIINSTTPRFFFFPSYGMWSAIFQWLEFFISLRRKHTFLSIYSSV